VTGTLDGRTPANSSRILSPPPFFQRFRASSYASSFCRPVTMSTIVSRNAEGVNHEKAGGRGTRDPVAAGRM